MTDTSSPWWAGPRLQVLLVFSVAVLVNLPYLGGGFAADDVLFLELLEIEPRPFTWWGGLWHERDPTVWSWLDFTTFRSLWWMEPDTLGSFWRPIFSLIFAGSVFVFGENAVPLHAISLAAHGAIGVCLVLLVRQLSGRSGLALLAGLLYVTCEDHSMGVGWIATMTDVLCVLFIMLALMGHAQWLRSRKRPALVASLVALAAAFMSKESAATAPLVIILLTFLVPRGVAEELDWSVAGLRDRFKACLRDVASWLPHGILLVVYLGLYKALGFGGMDNLMYIDPIGRPMLYLHNAALHGPVMWLATLSPFPPSTVMFMPETLPWLAVVGVVAMLLWLVSLWPERHNSLALWALATYWLALMPQLSTDASERGLYFPFIGAAILLALMLARLRASGPRSCRVAAWPVLLVIAIPGALMSLGMPWSFLRSFGAINRQIESALPHIRERQPEHVFVLNTSGVMVTFYAGGVLEHALGEPLDLSLISSCNAVVTLEKTGADSFILRVDRPGWFSNIFARVVRKEPRFVVGRRYDTANFEASVVEVTDDGADALAVAFRMKALGPNTLFLRWNGDRFEPFDLAAAPLGEAVVLGDSSDVWASMN